MQLEGSLAKVATLPKDEYKTQESMRGKKNAGQEAKKDKEGQVKIT